MGRVTFRLLLATLIAACTGLAGVWAVLVPPFQEPDEMAHLDYAFALYDVGRPYLVQEGVARYEVTAQTRYLDAMSHFRAMRYNPLAREPSGYGSAAFLRTIDSAAPRRSQRVPPPGSPVPYVMFSYPIGYYAALACIMAAADALSNHSLVAIFLAARLFNVVLLAVTLLLAAGIFRYSGLGRSTTLLATLGIGAFPLTTWVAGYAQPDNLSLVLVTAALYAILRWRRQHTWTRSAVLGLVLCALFFTKHQYALAAWLAALIFAASSTRRSGRRADVARIALIAIVPLLACTATLFATPVSHLSSITPFVTARLGETANHAAWASKTAAGFVRAVTDVFGGGDAFDGYWLGFGTRGAGIFPSPAVGILRYALVDMTLAFIALFALTQYRLMRRIVRLRPRREPIGLILRLTASNCAVNIYVILTVLLLGFGATGNGGLQLQGRYWLPVIVPAVLIVLMHLPKSFRRAPHRRIAAGIVAGTMAGYSTIAAAFAISAMHADFYGPQNQLARRDDLAAISTIQNSDRGIIVRGYAVDMFTGLPALSVSASLDEGRRRYAHTGLDTSMLADYRHDDEIRRSGFLLWIPPGALAPGRHRLRLEIDDPKMKPPLAIGHPVELNVTEPQPNSRRDT